MDSEYIWQNIEHFENLLETRQDLDDKKTQIISTFDDWTTPKIWYDSDDEKRYHYNVRLKSYPDGTQSFMFYTQGRVKNEIRDLVPKERLDDGSSIDRGQIQNNKRAVQRVYDLARSNLFQWFVTLTFSPDKVDRYDYEQCVDCLLKFTRWMRDHGCRWILVAEQHEDGAYHFHGIISGDLKLVHWRRGIYNIANFDWGYTTATKIRDPAKTASYICKYITKCFSVPKGKKRYWASRNLNEPYIEYTEMPYEEFLAILEYSDYAEVLSNPYGTFIIAENHGKEKELLI